MVTDPISDMIIRVKNANNAGKAAALIPYSKLKMEIMAVLEREGFVKAITKKGKKVRKFIEVELLYNGKTPRIRDISRISKPSRRIYLKIKDIKPIKHGYGRLLLSTPKGILTGQEAKKAKVGGEALFAIW
jgi:small subunit ribosomal protein S8